MSTATALPLDERRLLDLLPGISAAVSFSISDVLGKVVFASGMDVLSLVTLRGVLAAGFFWWWLRLAPPRVRHSPRARLVSIGLGLLFAANVFGLLLAIKLLPLSVAILAYFIYPLFTGIAAAALGQERLGWQGFAVATAAFCGLALMLGTTPAILAPLGLLGAFGAALCRMTSLLVTRAELGGTDARLTTWYTLLPCALVFLAMSGATGTFNPPLTAAGWFAFAGMSVATTLSTWLIFVSAARISAFRTALLLNLEPVLASGFGFTLLGEPASHLQLLGGAVMVVSVCAFQVRR